jgi:hypothetical protein
MRVNAVPREIEGVQGYGASAAEEVRAKSKGNVETHMKIIRNYRLVNILACGLCFGCSALAQQSTSSGPAWSPAQSINLFAFPKNNQSADQQLKDESECYGSCETTDRH